MIMDDTYDASRIAWHPMEMAGISNAPVVTKRELKGQALGERLSVEIQASTRGY